MFHAGMKVVCVDVSPNSVGYVPRELTLGRVYVIAEIDDGEDCEGDLGLFIEGITFRPNPIVSDSFKAYRFRPVVERKTSIEIFTKMLTPTGKENVKCLTVNSMA